MMNELLVIIICVISQAFSEAKKIDSNFQCDGHLYEYNATKGEVTSPLYYERDTYPELLWCEYRIRAPEGHRIKISFKVFDVISSDACGQDHLVIFSKDKARLLGIFCGTDIPKPLLSLPGESEIRIMFRTDFMVSGKGFVMEYESGPNLELCDTGLKECKNRNCYDPKKKCDGEDDCGDGTDEEDCGFPLVVEPELCGTPIFEPETDLLDSSPDRMVGGDIAIPNSWPWQVSLQDRSTEPNGHFCGGFLLNAQWVVTAAHCVAKYPDPADLKVVLGAHDKFNTTKYQQTRYGAKIITYPDLEGANKKRYSMSHDMSVIKLNAPVKFNDGVQPACLPSLGLTTHVGMHCYVTGWGETRGSGGSNVLKQQQQVVHYPLLCQILEKGTEICLKNVPQSPCHGDSGGPLQCKLGNNWFVFGVASYVIPSNYMQGICSGPKSKSVYSDVAAKADWIISLVNKYS